MDTAPPRPHRDIPSDQCIFCGRIQTLNPEPIIVRDALVYSGTCDFDGYLLDAVIEYDDLTPAEQAWVDAMNARKAQQRRDDPLYDRMCRVFEKDLPNAFEDALLYGTGANE